MRTSWLAAFVVPAVAVLGTLGATAAWGGPVTLGEDAGGEPTGDGIAGEVAAGPIVRAATGHRYFLLLRDDPTQFDWLASEARAVALGGHLVTINDRAENDFVFSTFGRFNGLDLALAIGLTDAREEG
jgi:hypothetical protein